MFLCNHRNSLPAVSPWPLRYSRYSSRCVCESPMIQEPDPLHFRHRILIVDDEPSVRTMFQRVLHHAGFDAIAATGGADGLRLLKQDPTIGLVMLDLMMPECDGWRFRHAQRT